MKHLPDKTIHALHGAAIRSGLSPSRTALLSGLDAVLVAGFPGENNPGAQLLADLKWMNELETLDGSVLLADWLRNALLLVGPRSDSRVFRQALEELTKSAAPQVGSAPVAPPSGGAEPQLLALDEDAFHAHKDGQALLGLLERAYPTSSEIAMIAARAGVDLSRVPLHAASREIWFKLATAAIRAATFPKLIDAILADSSVVAYHARIRALL
jgi:hypothetical protein